MVNYGACQELPSRQSYIIDNSHLLRLSSSKMRARKFQIARLSKHQEFGFYIYSYRIMVKHKCTVKKK